MIAREWRPCASGGAAPLAPWCLIDGTVRIVRHLRNGVVFGVKSLRGAVAAAVAMGRTSHAH